MAYCDCGIGKRSQVREASKNYNLPCCMHEPEHQHEVSQTRCWRPVISGKSGGVGSAKRVQPSASVLRRLRRAKHHTVIIAGAVRRTC